MTSSVCRTRYALILAIHALVPCSQIAAAADFARLPNVVLIISDDQAYDDFGFIGSPLAHTPHLDRLAAASARYVNAYVPTSVCRPSLATILTGLYPHQHGIYFNHSPPGNAAFNRMASADEYVEIRSRSFDAARRVATLPRTLRDRLGYRSFQTGKFWEGHYENAGFTDGMTVFQAAPGQAFGGNRVLASGDVVAHGNGDRGLAIGRTTMQPLFDFIDACGEAPFLVWYAPFLPHRPHDPPAEFVDRYADRPDVPAHAVPYLASVSFFDHTVGQLVGHVEDRGLADNTIFVFVVDNGWRPSSHRAPGSGDYEHTKRSKRAPFDDGLRTPILIRWDGHVAPATHPELASSIDLMPTLLSAVGLRDEAAGLPGRDLLPSATGRRPLDPDRAIFGEIYPGDASTLDCPAADVAYRWVRQGKLKLIVPHCHGRKPPWGGYLDEVAMYDVVADPDETNNLAHDADYAERRRALRRLLDDWWTPDQDDCPPPSGDDT